MRLLCVTCVTALLGVAACDIYEPEDRTPPTPSQEFVVIAAEPADSVAVGDTLTLRAVLIEGGNPERFRFE